MIIKKAIPIAGVGLLAPSVASADAYTDSKEYMILSDKLALQSYYNDLYNSYTTSKPVSESVALSAAQSKVNSASNALKSTSRNPVVSYSNKVTPSVSWINGYNRYIDAKTKDEKTSASNFLSTIADAEASRNLFNGTGLDKTKKYDLLNLPESELININRYFTELINSFHEAMGQPDTVYVNTNTMSFAKSVAQGYTSANFVAMTGHNINIINNTASNYGLKTNPSLNMYENLTQAYVTSNKAQKFSQYDIYQMLYDSFMNMTIYDVYSSFGHTKSLLSADTIGLAFSKANSDGWDYYQLHIETVASNQMVNPGPTEYPNVYGIPASTTIKPFPAQANAQIAYDNGIVELSSAQSKYNSASAAISYSASLVKNSLMAINSEVASAQSAYDSYVRSMNPGSSTGSLTDPIIVQLLIKASLYIENK